MSQPINGSSPTEGTGGSDPRVTIISTYDDAPDSLEGTFAEGYKFAQRVYQFDGVESYVPQFNNLSEYVLILRRVYQFDSVESYDPEFINLSDGYTIVP